MVMKGFYMASHFTLNTVYSRFLLSVQIHCLFSSCIVFQSDPLFFLLSKFMYLPACSHFNKFGYQNTKYIDNRYHHKSDLYTNGMDSEMTQNGSPLTSGLRVACFSLALTFLGEYHNIAIF